MLIGGVVLVHGLLLVCMSQKMMVSLATLQFELSNLTTKAP